MDSFSQAGVEFEDVEDADAGDQPDLHDAAYWDRSAAQMVACVVHYESQGEWSKAAYYRPFIARFEQAAARIRGSVYQ